MSVCEVRTPSPTNIDPFGLLEPRASNVLVEHEPQWRCLPGMPCGPGDSARIGISRWHSRAEGKREVAAETPADRHVVAIVLRDYNVEFSIGGRVLHDGPAGPGIVHVSQPSTSARGLFRGAYDVLHLHVPNTLIAECRHDRPGEPGAELATTKTLKRDCRIEALGRALVEADKIDGSFGGLYADSISTAIVAGLMAGSAHAGPAGRVRSSGLAKWRMKRAVDYIEANLAESLSLPSIASVAGLTRMHFAAQFKATTGLRPHEYVLRRRIDRAQRLLCEGAMSVVDVALAVGFQNQSHFTTVFKRFVGQPPWAWRRTLLEEACFDSPRPETALAPASDLRGREVKRCPAA